MSNEDQPKTYKGFESIIVVLKSLNGGGTKFCEYLFNYSNQIEEFNSLGLPDDCLETVANSESKIQQFDIVDEKGFNYRVTLIGR